MNYAYISSVDNHGQIDTDDESEVNHLSTEQKRIVLPSFKSMMNFVHEMCEKRLTSSSVQKEVYGKVIIVYSYETYTEVKPNLTTNFYKYF